MSENAAASAHNGGLNRAKLYQLVQIGRAHV